MTKVALVGMVSHSLYMMEHQVDGGYIRHQGHGNAGAEKRTHGEECRDGGTQTSAASQEAREEGARLKEQSDEEEDPAKPPEVVILLGGGVIAAAADERAGRVLGVRVPGLAKGGRGTGLAAVVVALAAEVKVGPLGDVAGAGDAAGVGAEEVDLVEGRGVFYAGEDEEPEEEEGAGHEDEGSDAQGPV